MAKRRKKRYRARGQFSISIAGTTHQALKALAESQGKSMRQVVEEWVGVLP